MTPEQHRQVKEILGTVLETEPEERSEALVSLCGTDALLRREVESLLAFEEMPVGLTGEPIVSVRPDDGLKEGNLLGTYRILRCLGYGGMGAVYLAEQEGAVRRRVALKVIHRGLKTHEILHRFQMERQILARLDHPYIARLLDAGATDDGRPYFAMDFVDGRPIDEYCERAKLPLKMRLQLFRKVLDAVYFSHQNLVIHRDLKPGNILVTESGTPKLLDFGIAKLLEPTPSLRSLTTFLGRPPMTPAFASPEAVRSEGVGIASDVYSLGVLLYLLLTDRHPYDVAGRQGRELERIICDVEPKRPSSWAREIDCDLDCIISKALRKEPGERYSSVMRLADDVDAYLKGHPVAARAGNLSYRAIKFARRHRIGLWTAAAFLLTAVTFVGTLLVQLERIRDERNRAQVARDLFVEILESTDPREEEENLAPENVVQRGLDLYGEDFAEERAIHADVFDSLGRVYTQRGYGESARRLLQEALAIRLALFGDGHLRVAESRLNLAGALGALGQRREAAELSEMGLKVFRRHYKKAHPELAKAINNYAIQLKMLGRRDEAEPLFREALDMKIELYGETHLSVATGLANLASLHRAREEFGPARQKYQGALQIRLLRLPPKHPKIGKTYNQIGSLLLAVKDFQGALPYLRSALEIHQQKHGPEHPDVASTLYRLGFAQHGLQCFEEAESLYRQALDIRCAQKEGTQCGVVKKSFAKLLLDQGKLESAQDLATAALDIFEAEGDTREAAAAMGVLGESLVRQGEFSRAEDFLRASYRIYCEPSEKRIGVTEAHRRLVELYQAWNRPEEAERFRQGNCPETPHGGV